MNVYSGIFHQYLRNDINFQHIEPTRKRNRFGDGLEEIIINKVEFYPSNYVPKKPDIEVMQIQVGLPTFNEAITSSKKIQGSVLSTEQSALIYVYTVESQFYPALNAAMRSGTKEERLAFQDYIYYLTNTLNLLDPFNGPVYRGINCQISDYKPGKSIVWPAFSSSTKNPKIAIEFLKGKSGTLFLINAKTPRTIDKYSAIKTEEEVLFLPNSSFKIVAKVSGASRAMLEKALQISEEITIFELNEI